MKKKSIEKEKYKSNGVISPKHRCNVHKIQMNFKHFFFQLGFTPCKSEQPLRGMELQEREAQKINAYRKSVYKVPTVKRYLLILDLKPFRS